ncbi:MAG: hypothetical protein IT477_07095 [Rhodanobacteraceae bacterium]|nr:hypothetical protein [Rhodanobacteraceae bacterium]
MKGLDHQRHNDKKKPQHSFEEKRALKRAKKLARAMEAGGLTKLPDTAPAH